MDGQYHQSGMDMRRFGSAKGSWQVMTLESRQEVQEMALAVVLLFEGVRGWLRC